MSGWALAFTVVGVAWAVVSLIIILGIIWIMARDAR